MLLPIAPFTETAGTFVNAEGRVQSFNGVVKPLGEARPAWKVLRVLGNLLGLAGFDYETAEEVRDEALGDRPTLAARLSNAPTRVGRRRSPGRAGRARAHRRRADLFRRRAGAPGAVAAADRRRAAAGRRRDRHAVEQLGLQHGDQVRITQDGGEAVLPSRDDPTPADNAVRIAAALRETACSGRCSAP